MRGGSRPALLLAGVLAAAGAWQLGSAGWLFAKAELAQILLARAWQRTLAGEAEALPWSWADTWPVARLEAPEHGVDLYVLAGGRSEERRVGKECRCRWSRD